MASKINYQYNKSDIDAKQKPIYINKIYDIKIKKKDEQHNKSIKNNYNKKYGYYTGIHFNIDNHYC